MIVHTTGMNQLKIDDALLQCIPIFSQVFDKWRIYDQHRRRKNQL